MGFAQPSSETARLQMRIDELMVHVAAQLGIRPIDADPILREYQAANIISSSTRDWFNTTAYEVVDWEMARRRTALSSPQVREQNQQPTCPVHRQHELTHIIDGVMDWWFCGRCEADRIGKFIASIADPEARERLRRAWTRG